MTNQDSTLNNELSQEEVWMPVVRREILYEVSNRGRVRSKRSGIMKTFKTDGYVRIELKGPKRKELVHRLVAEAFFGPPPEDDSEVDHKNGIRWDNCVKNLEWVTPCENQRRAFATGLRSPLRGEECPWAKITEVDVAKIISRVRTGETQLAVGKDFGIKQPQVSRIIAGLRWNIKQPPLS